MNIDFDVIFKHWHIVFYIGIYWSGISFWLETNKWLWLFGTDRPYEKRKIWYNPKNKKQWGFIV